MARTLRFSRMLIAATVGCLAAGVIVTRWVRFTPDPGHTLSWCSQLLIALSFGLVGAVISEQAASPQDRIGTLLQLTAATQAADLLFGSWSRREVAGAGIAAWCDGWLWAAGVAPLLTVFLLLLPTGAALAGVWRIGTRVGGGVCVAFVAAQAVDSWPGITAGPAVGVGTTALALTSLFAVVGLFVRYRRSDTAGRAQLKWIGWALLVVLIAEPAQAVLPAAVGKALLAVLPLLLPIAVWFAVSRFRLFDVDLVISRTVAYAVLTALLAAAYVGLAILLGAESTRAVDRAGLAAVISVALVAVPVHRGLQTLLDRWLLGKRSTQAAVQRLTRRLQQTLVADEVPETVVRTVAEALRVPYVRLSISAPGAPPVRHAEVGTPASTVDLPVTYAGRHVGMLAVGRRAPRDAFDGAELALLESLVTAAAPALDAVLLTEELRAERRRVVLAREQERARLHRDLHDGLGPTLAGIALGLDAVHNVLAQGDTQGALPAVERLRELAGGVTTDVRSVVNGLRPSALDEQGLVAVIRRHAGAALGDTTGLTVEVEVAGDLDQLPDAVEVAALRIALEAITNVRRHANAQHCWVRLALVEGRLRVEVDDDGEGFRPSTQPGVGLRSMRERAEELGGSGIWRRSERGGVAVRAELPVAAIG